VQVGGRFATMKVGQPLYSNTGPLFGGTVTQGDVSSQTHAFTYLLTPQFIVSPNAMVYARFASGYRPGGPNLPATYTADPTVPKAYGPDKTENYEIGAKGDLFDHVLSFDTSIYYIDWRNIQIQGLISPATRVNYKANGGAAKSQGVELALDFRPWDGMKIAAAGAWSLAALKQSFPSILSVRGVDGDRLPFSSRFSGSVSADQEFPLSALGVRGFVGIFESYVGDRVGPFVAAGTPRADLPAYYDTDLHAGVRGAQWEASAYVDNLADRRGLLEGGAGSLIPNIYTYTRPRTFGVSFTTRF
jgi:iron complex outermembrane receptor protein